jgi:hypothetical protein
MEREKTNLGPHVGIVRFNIFIHKMLPDGSIDPVVVDCQGEFRDSKMASIGEFHVTGFDKWNCIEKVKKKLENLNG